MERMSRALHRTASHHHDDRTRRSRHGGRGRRLDRSGTANLNKQQTDQGTKLQLGTEYGVYAHTQH